MRTPLVAFLLTVLCVPAVTAQNVGGPPTAQIEAYPPDMPLMPETGLAEIRIILRVGCTLDDLRNEPTRVLFSLAQLPTYASAILEPAIVSHTYGPQMCAANPQSYWPFHTRLTVSVTRDAPAFMDGIYQVHARVEKPGGGSYGPYEATFAIKNDYVPNVAVETGPTLVHAEPGERISLPLALTNLGNGPTRVRIEVQPTTRNRLDALAPGAETLLESRAGRGDSAAYKAIHTIRAVAPAENGHYGFVATVRPAYDGTGVGLRTDEQQIGYTIIVEGASDETAQAFDEEHAGASPSGVAPGAASVWLALTLAGAALWRRR